jgi:hypothetical protein
MRPLGVDENAEPGPDQYPADEGTLDDPSETPPDAANGGGYPASVAATLGWFVLPAVVYLFLVLHPDELTPPGCGGIISNLGCAPVRQLLIDTLVRQWPWLAGTVSLGVVISMVLRYFNTSWRARGTGFASAVIAGGVATVAYSILAGTT